MKVGAIVANKQVATIDPDASLDQLLAILAEKKIGALVVSSDGRSIEGIVSERDIVRAMPGQLGSLGSLRVRDMMTAEVITCVPETTVAELMALMTDMRIRHVPVVDAEGSLASIVSIGDVVKAHIDEIDAERNALRGYVTS
jgi:CBS domain-containing protein